LGTKINVELNQVVKGGRTVLAELLNNVALPSETSDVVETHIPDVEKPLSDEHGEPTLVIEHDLEKEQATEKPVDKATPAKKPVASAKPKPTAAAKPKPAAAAKPKTVKKSEKK
jgi:phosphatidylserine decarboxylase